MNKTELRKSAILKREQYSEAECTSMSQTIMDHFFLSPLFDLSAVSYLHLFLPMKKKKEVNTFPLFTKLLVEYPQVRIVLPKCNPKENTLSHFLYSHEVTLTENAYGIPEPDSGAQISADRIDMVLIPLLVADLKGNRIGYGKGFYDRFLAECRPDCTKIGLSFEPPVKHISAEPFDIPLDYCITPKAILDFRKVN